MFIVRVNIIASVLLNYYSSLVLILIYYILNDLLLNINV